MKITVLLAALAVLTIAGGPPIFPSTPRSTFARNSQTSPTTAAPGDAVKNVSDPDRTAGELPDGHSACPHHACMR